MPSISVNLLRAKVYIHIANISKVLVCNLDTDTPANRAAFSMTVLEFMDGTSDTISFKHLSDTADTALDSGVTWTLERARNTDGVQTGFLLSDSTTSVLIADTTASIRVQMARVTISADSP